jgi:hypothetical protein
MRGMRLSFWFVVIFLLVILQANLLKHALRSPGPGIAADAAALCSTADCDAKILTPKIKPDFTLQLVAVTMTFKLATNHKVIF